MMATKACISLFMCLFTITVASYNETTSEVSEKEAKTELTYTLPYYSLTPFRTGILVLGLSMAVIAILYLPAMLYRICLVFGGCQSEESRIRRDQFISSQLSTARDIRLKNGRALSAGPILATLARAHEKYA